MLPLGANTDFFVKEDKTKWILQLVPAIRCAGPVSFDSAPFAKFAREKTAFKGDILYKLIGAELDIANQLEAKRLKGGRRTIPIPKQ